MRLRRGQHHVHRIVLLVRHHLLDFHCRRRVLEPRRPRAPLPPPLEPRHRQPRGVAPRGGRRHRGSSRRPRWSPWCRKSCSARPQPRAGGRPGSPPRSDGCRSGPRNHLGGDGRVAAGAHGRCHASGRLHHHARLLGDLPLGLLHVVQQLLGQLPVAHKDIVQLRVDKVL